MAHWHDRRDVDVCVDVHLEWPEPLRVILATLDRLESQVSTQQTSIDTAVDVLNAVVAELADVKSQLAAAQVDTVDTSKLDAAVVAAQAALTPAPAPAPAPEQPAAPVEQPAPADQPVAPAVDAAPSAPGDVVAPAAPVLPDAVIA